LRQLLDLYTRNGKASDFELPRQAERPAPASVVPR